MDGSRFQKIPKEDPAAVYAAVITKDGDLALPEAYLAGKVPSEGDRSLILTNAPDDGALSLYTHDAFDTLCKQVEHLPLDQETRTFKRRIIGEAVEVDVDKRGHITIEPELLSRQGLDPDRNNGGDHPVKILEYSHRLQIVMH